MLNVMEQTSKQLVKSLFQFKELPAVPFVPIVSSFAAKLEQLHVSKMLSDPTLLSRSLINSHALFGYDAITTVFDPSLEAEALGCVTNETSEEEPRKVASNPLGEAVTVESLGALEIEKKGRLPVILEATKRISILKGRDVALVGIITGPVTLARHLKGNVVLKELEESPQEVLPVIELTGQVMLKLCHAYFAQGADIIGIADYMLCEVPLSSFDMMAPVFQTLANVVKYYKSHCVILTGECPREYIEPIFGLQCDGVVVGGNTDLELAKNVSIKHGRCLGIGVPRALLLGAQAEIGVAMKNYLSIKEKSGVFISTEYEVPYAAPIANLRQTMEEIRLGNSR